MRTAIDWLGQVTGIGSQSVGKLLLTAGVIVVLVAIRWGLVAILNRRAEDARVRYRWRKTATYSLTVAGLILIGRIWLEGVQTLVTYLGLVSAGIAIALRDPILNWFGWLFIGWRRPFTVGDRIQIGSLAGDVIDIGVSTFSVLEVAAPEHGEQVTGRIVHVPNGKVFVDPLTNITQGFNYVWNEIPVTVTFESDWCAAKEILQRIVAAEADAVTLAAEQGIRRAGRRFMLHPESTEPAVYTRIAEDGVELTIRYLCEPKRRRITTQAIGEAILEAFSEAPRIDFAYRTSRIFRQTEEGKATLRPTAESS